MNDAPRTARRLLGQVRALREEVALVGETLITRWHPLVADTAFRKSAQNLAHYLALRRNDLRTLQQALSPLGVSSLGRCEAHVLPTLDAVLATLGVIAGADPATLPPRPSRRAFAESERTLARVAKNFAPTWR